MYKPFTKALIRMPLQSLNVLDDKISDYYSNEYFMEGVYLSSSEFYDQLNKDKSENNVRGALSLKKYWIRSAIRSTPFATFAGCGLIDISDENETNIIVKDVKKYKKKVRLDMNIVTLLTDALVNDPVISKKLKFFSNNSIYFAHDEVRFIEYELVNNIRHYKLSKVDKSSYLIDILDLAKGGKRIDELANFLTKSLIDVSYAEAEDFVNELISSQILISQLEPIITGIDPFTHIVEQAELARIDKEILNWLKELHSAINEKPIGLKHYFKINSVLEKNFWSLKMPKNIIQTDLYLNLQAKTISKKTVTSLIKQCEELSVLSRDLSIQDLIDFKIQFIEKFGEETIPLAIALDDDLGIGYSNVTDKNTCGNEFIDHLPVVLTPIKQEYSFKFQRLITRLIFSLKLCVYLDSISPLV